MTFENPGNGSSWLLAICFVVIAILFAFAYHRAFQEFNREFDQSEESQRQLEYIFWNRSPSPATANPAPEILTAELSDEISQPEH